MIKSEWNRKYYNGEIIVDFEEETELEKKYNEVAELYSKAVKKKIEYRKEIERLNNIINEFEQELIKKLEAVKTIKNTLGEGAYVLNPHIDLLEQEYNYFYKKLQELKGSDKEWLNI